MKFTALLLLFAINTYAATPEQELAWSKFSTINEIKRDVSGATTPTKCVTAKETALFSGCVNQTIIDLLSITTLNYAPVCSSENVITGFNRCGPTPEQIKQIRLYSSEQFIHDRVGGSTYCNNQGRMENELCPSAREYALESNCIAQWQYDLAVPLNYAPACMPNQAGIPVLLGFCKCGCFSQDNTLISGETGLLSFEDLKIFSGSITTLAEESTIEDFATDQASLSSLLAGNDVYKIMITIKTGGGTSLTVTNDHAILLASGEVVSAENVTKDDYLISELGELVEIESINRAKVITSVFNLQTNAPVSDGKGHLIFANGLAVGDIVWQSELSREVDAINIRNL